MKLIQFSNGKFGVRRGVWPFYSYRDLRSFGTFWWFKYSTYFKDCMGSEESARKLYVNPYIKDKVIN